MDPANTSASPAVSRSSFRNSSPTAASGMAGPRPLISPSSSALIFTLMRVSPSSSQMKSVRSPEARRPSSKARPVNPARKPRAVFSMPRLCSTVETLIPFPPNWIVSYAVRFSPPGWKSFTPTT